MIKVSLSFNTLGRPLVTMKGNLVVCTSSHRAFIVHRTIYNRLASGAAAVIDGVLEEVVLKSGGRTLVFKERKSTAIQG